MDSCTFDEAGIVVNGDDATITNNTFNLNEDDVGVTLNADATVEESIFTGASGTGIEVADCIEADIEDNVFDGLDHAIVVDPVPASPVLTIRGNTIKNSEDVAIVIHAAEKIIIADNHFLDNEDLVLEVTDDGDNVKMLFNVMEGNEDTVEGHSDNYVVDASHNYWDVDVEDTDEVKFEPALTVKPTSGAIVMNTNRLTVTFASPGVDVRADEDALVIAAAMLTANPGIAPEHPSLPGAFYDIYLGEPVTDEITEVIIRLYHGDIAPGSLAYVWSDLAGKWVKCDNQDFNTVAGYVYVVLGDDTVPSIEDLSGIPFALV